MKPILLVENFFSRTQFADHLVTASHEATYTESWRVGTGRRSRRDQWSPGVSGVDTWVRVDCGVPREATMIALDRGHNLAGLTVKLQGSADGAAWGDVVSTAVPAAPGSGGSVDAAGGVTTEEGAWLRRFDAASHRYWRLLVPAGATVPEVVGLWVGMAWTPELYPDLPWSDSERQLAAEEVESEAGWVGATRVRRPRTGELTLKLVSSAEYEQHARYHLEQHFFARRPMWMVLDPAHAERTVLALPRPGQVGFSQQAGWSPRQAKIAWLEHEPRP